uniref:Mitochondrial brown fat uncoupling protein 1 n=1 Tax=Scleropages formosus TaxID=113540 RepID=A0A8C9R217_SCLFO
ASVCIGLYETALPPKNSPYTSHSPPPGANIVTQLMAGCTISTMAVSFAKLTDVVKVCFQAQVRLPNGVKGYNGTMNADRTTTHDEGIRGLWKGCILNITNDVPQCHVNVFTCACVLLCFADTSPCRLTAAFVAGSCTTIVASPVDVVKTRFVNSSTRQYSSTVNYAITCSLQGNIVMFISYEKRIEFIVYHWSMHSFVCTI